MFSEWLSNGSAQIHACGIFVGCTVGMHSMTPDEKLLLDKESNDFLPRHIGITNGTKMHKVCCIPPHPILQKEICKQICKQVCKRAHHEVWYCSGSCFLAVFCLLDTERCISGVGEATAASNRSRSLLVLSNPLTLRFPNLPPIRKEVNSAQRASFQPELETSHMTTFSTRTGNNEGPNRWMWWAGIEIESARIGSTWINYSQTWIDLARAHPWYRQMHNHGTGHTPSAHAGYPSQDRLPSSFE